MAIVASTAAPAQRPHRCRDRRGEGALVEHDGRLLQRDAVERLAHLGDEPGGEVAAAARLERAVDERVHVGVARRRRE